MLVLVERRVPASALRRRSFHGDSPRRRPRARRERGRGLASLSFARECRPGVPAVPVGLPAARGGPSRDLPRVAASLAIPKRPRGVPGRPLPAALASLPSHVLVGLGQARERRSHVAQSLRPALPLRNAAAATLDRVVPAPVPALVPDRVGALALLRRARRSLPLLRAAARASLRLPRHGPAAAAHRRDGQLRVFQPAGAGARPAPPGRPVSSAEVAARGRRGGGPAPLLAEPGPRAADLRRAIRVVGRVCGHARPLARSAAAGRCSRTTARRLSQLQPVRPLHGHDDRTAGDPDRGQRRRRRVASIRVSMETGRRRAPAALRRTAPAPPRLADVVRRAREPRGESVAPPVPRPAPRGVAGGRGPPRVEPVSGSSAALRARDALRLPIHGLRRAPPLRGLVAAPGSRPLLPGSGVHAKPRSGPGSRKCRARPVGPCSRPGRRRRRPRGSRGILRRHSPCGSASSD